MWPYHWTEEGRKQGVERMIKIKNSDPNATYLKAYDEQTGEIMGMAKWYVLINSYPVKAEGGSPVPYWESEEDKFYAGQMVDNFVKDRNVAIAERNGNVVGLDILTVDPAHQRKKVGDALVKWGINKADELGLDAIVESSVFGKGLYEKNGFIFSKNVDVEVSSMPDRPKGAYAWGIRPKKEKQAV